STQDYFVSGLTEALTTDLAKVAGLRVIPRLSAIELKRAKKRPPAIGQDLNVDAVVEGAIARSGQRVHITVQLIRAATDSHVWANSYDVDVSEVIAEQQSIAREIVTVIDARLALPPPAAGLAPGINPDAYDEYLKGVFACGQENYEGYRTG